jgi:hypothetical protein
MRFEMSYSERLLSLPEEITIHQPTDRRKSMLVKQEKIQNDIKAQNYVADSGHGAGGGSTRPTGGGGRPGFAPGEF